MVPVSEMILNRSNNDVRPYIVRYTSKRAAIRQYYWLMKILPLHSELKDAVVEAEYIVDEYFKVVFHSTFRQATKDWIIDHQ